jgi:Amt family ammonium transporter
VFAQKLWNPGGNDGLLAGNPGQLGVQALGAATSLVYAGLMTFVILKVLGLVVALRPAARTEGVGMDVSEHGEEAYTTGEGSILVMQESTTSAPARVLTPQAAAR